MTKAYHSNTYKCRTNENRATGGTFFKIFDIQNQKFISVMCERCTYAEFYKTKTNGLSNVFDFFTN
ncbi:zinc ribbon domain-containing protein [Flavivirga jejuensis]|uniref:Zinc ribbon domain-containing protein n=1 Tax=Flavivirga jejuensis TaxID=870487 RepID=A0ABT8WQE8_9FLAO|nr:zinc ribbon domain-containing protein [Flavivirga jejuensis]MDO5975397.1 zinc ribbon domain-containing protein [Flavivirga jejuensis]